MHFLIDANSDGTRPEEMRSVFAQRGIDLRAVKLFPQSAFPHDIANAEDIAIDANAVCFGGPVLLHHIQNNRRWKPGGWCTFANFSCDVYYTYYGSFLLNNRYTLLPASEACRQSDFLFEQFACNGEVFARPSAGRKLFTGNTFEIDDFKQTASMIDDPRSLVLISSPQRIGREWRLYVAHDKVITFSQYAVNGERDIQFECPSDVLDFGNEILEQTSWRPDPIFSMDLCECDGQIRLLELNGFSCSNLYACDLNLIIEAVVQTVKPATNRGITS